MVFKHKLKQGVSLLLDLCQDLKIKKNPSKKTRKALKESVENQLFSQLVDQTNPRPVETGSDWDIPSRFSFQPVAPRKNLDCMTPPTVSSDWLCAATQGGSLAADWTTGASL